ncbi:hypothetical protein DK058_25050 [Salmonella enterica subsp. enterica serovar Typhi]|nr:hypothetical protein [Salmonella enterica subsp. enterica serovar Typhi]
MPDRAPCINPRCRRTFKQEHDGQEVICGKCFRALPQALRLTHRRCWREIRKWHRRILRTIDPLRARRMHVILDRWGARLDANWELIRKAVTAPEKPDGLDAFLEEMGL